jgi:hypothetical protein
MSTYKIQTLGYYPEESIQHSEHGESLESRIIDACYQTHVSQAKTVTASKNRNPFELCSLWVR